jgi:hypothetical protein
MACGANDDRSTTAAPSGLSGAAGTGVEGTVTCGGAICRRADGPGLMLPVEACCVDHFTRTCGVLMGTSCRKQPEPHPTCASLDWRDFGLILFGCCVDNKCGLYDEFEGGCRDVESLQAEAMATGEDVTLLPPAMACDSQVR